MDLRVRQDRAEEIKSVLDEFWTRLFDLTTKAIIPYCGQGFWRLQMCVDQH